MRRWTTTTVAVVAAMAMTNRISRSWDRWRYCCVPRPIGTMSDRTYTIDVEGWDASGNTLTQSVQVKVVKHRRH